MHSFILLVNNGKPECKFTDFSGICYHSAYKTYHASYFKGGLYGNMDVTSLSLSIQTIVKGTKSYSSTFASNY